MKKLLILSACIFAFAITSTAQNSMSTAVDKVSSIKKMMTATGTTQITAKQEKKLVSMYKSAYSSKKADSPKMASKITRKLNKILTKDQVTAITNSNTMVDKTKVRVPSTKPTTKPSKTTKPVKDAPVRATKPSRTTKATTKPGKVTKEMPAAQQAAVEKEIRADKPSRRTTSTDKTNTKPTRKPAKTPSMEPPSVPADAAIEKPSRRAMNNAQNGMDTKINEQITGMDRLLIKNKVTALSDVQKSQLLDVIKRRYTESAAARKNLGGDRVAFDTRIKEVNTTAIKSYEKVLEPAQWKVLKERLMNK